MWQWFLLAIVGVLMVGNGIWGLASGRIHDPTEFDLITRTGEPFMYWATVIFCVGVGGWMAIAGWRRFRDGAPADDGSWSDDS